MNAALQGAGRECGQEKRGAARADRAASAKLSSHLFVDLIELKIKFQDTPRRNGNAVVAD